MPTTSPARWSGPWPRPRAAAKSRWPITRPTASRPKSVKSRISDILDSVYEKDHVRADISDFATAGAHGRQQPRGPSRSARTSRCATPPPTSTSKSAARLRDEIKRLREIELGISDDPLARYAEAESPVSGREKGKHNKGRAIHRAVDDNAISPQDLRTQQRASVRKIPVRQAFAGRHGPRHRRGEAGRRCAALAVQEELARRDDRAAHRKAGSGRRSRRSRGFSLPKAAGRPGQNPSSASAPASAPTKTPGDTGSQKRRPGKTGRPGR